MTGKEDNKTGRKTNPTTKMEGIAIKPDQPNALTLDWKLYEGYLEDSKLMQDQKREFIETLLGLIVSFVDLGFEIHPVQQVGGEELNLSKLLTQSQKNMAKSTPSSQE